MKAIILSIGDEILIGQVTDTNSNFIASELTKIGVEVSEIRSISDSAEVIVQQIDAALGNYELIITTGGLGPTKDDISKQTIAKYFGVDLVTDQESLGRIQRFVDKRGLDMNELNRLQAEVPENARVLPNYLGTAPGMWFKEKDSNLIMLPGVPFEMKKLISEFVIPELQKCYQLNNYIQRNIYIHGIAESSLAIALEKWEESLQPDVKLAYLPSPGRIRLRLSAVGFDKLAIDKRLDNCIKAIEQYLPANVYMQEDLDIEQALAELLLKNKLSVSTAESCTGGGISRKIISVPGSSVYFNGSVVAYANETKVNVLKVNVSDIDKYGAVSEQVVKQMAAGVLSLTNSDYAVATSGIAGPDGGSDEKPVGTVWMAVASNTSVRAKCFQFGGTREVIMDRSVASALNFLRLFILEENGNIA